MAKRKKILKHDTENEQVIIALLLQNKKVRKLLVQTLEGNEFVASRHRVIFKGVKRLVEQRLKFTLDSLVVELRGEDFGSLDYLRKLKKAYGKEPENIDYHVSKLKLDSLKFNLRKGAAEELLEVLENPKSSINEISEAIGFLQVGLRKDARGLNQQTLKGKGAIAAYDAEVLKRESQEFRGFSFLELDEKLTQALVGGGISIIAARPSMGKSTFVANTIRKLAVRKVKTLYAPLETKWSDNVDTILTSATGISYDDYIKNPNNLTKKQRQKIARMKKRIFAPGYLTIWRPEYRTIDALENELATGNYEVVFIDLFENIVASLDASDLSLDMKRLQHIAQEYNVHLCLVHQLLRAVVKRKAKRPLMADLKNSGGYEEAADLILLLHRDKYYALQEGDNDDMPDVMEIWIAKQRRGITNVCVAYEFDKECGRIGEYAENWVPWEISSGDLKEGIV